MQRFWHQRSSSEKVTNRIFALVLFASSGKNLLVTCAVAYPVRVACCWSLRLTLVGLSRWVVCSKNRSCSSSTACSPHEYFLPQFLYMSAPLFSLWYVRKPAQNVSSWWLTRDAVKASRKSSSALTCTNSFVVFLWRRRSRSTLTLLCLVPFKLVDRGQVGEGLSSICCLAIGCHNSSIQQGEPLKQTTNTC